MKNLNFLFFAGILFLASTLISCQKSGKITFSEVAVDSTRIIALDSPTGDDTKALVISKGATWRLWRKIHLECMRDQWLTNPYYFGVSGNINLGSIVDKKYDLQRTMDATSGFTETDINTVTNYGNYASCGLYQEMTMSLNAFLKSDFVFPQLPNDTIAAELSAAIKSSTTNSMKIDAWRINNIREENLAEMLNDSSANKKMKAYRNTLLKKDHIVLIKVIEVHGFTSKIILTNELSASLRAKLTNGIVASLGNTGLEASFKLIGTNSIEASSGNNFYVFGEFKKGKLIEN